MEQQQIEIYQTADGESRIDVRFQDQTVWLSQAQLVDLFEKTKQNISLHINNIFKEGELSKEAVVRDSLCSYFRRLQS